MTAAMYLSVPQPRRAGLGSRVTGTSRCTTSRGQSGAHWAVRILGRAPSSRNAAARLAMHISAPPTRGQKRRVINTTRRPGHEARPRRLDKSSCSKRRHEWQVAVLVLIVEPVADNEFVRYFERHMIGTRRHFTTPRLAEQDQRPQGRRLTLTHQLEHLLQRVTGVENIVNQQDLFAADVEQPTGVQLQLPAFDAAPVAAGLYEGDSERHFQFAESGRRRARRCPS